MENLYLSIKHRIAPALMVIACLAIGKGRASDLDLDDHGCLAPEEAKSLFVDVMSSLTHEGSIDGWQVAFDEEGQYAIETVSRLFTYFFQSNFDERTNAMRRCLITALEREPDSDEQDAFLEGMDVGIAVPMSFAVGLGENAVSALAQEYPNLDDYFNLVSADEIESDPALGRFFADSNNYESVLFIPFWLEKHPEGLDVW